MHETAHRSFFSGWMEYSSVPFILRSSWAMIGSLTLEGCPRASRAVLIPACTLLRIGSDDCMLTRDSCQIGFDCLGGNPAICQVDCKGAQKELCDGECVVNVVALTEVVKLFHG